MVGSNNLCQEKPYCERVIYTLSSLLNTNTSTKITYYETVQYNPQNEKPVARNPSDPANFLMSV